MSEVDALLRRRFGPKPPKHRSEHIATLWSGYGHIWRITIQNSPSLIVKQVDPPRSSLTPSDESHRRKLESYRVETNFYNSPAPESWATATASFYESIGAGKVPGLLPIALEVQSDEKFTRAAMLLSDLAIEFPNGSPGDLDLEHAHAALRTLGLFHAFFWEERFVKWPAGGYGAQGGYWYLDTRMKELEAIPPHMEFLRKMADRADKYLKGFREEGGAVRKDDRFRTLLHGDSKDENMQFRRKRGSKSAPKNKGRNNEEQSDDSTGITGGVHCAILDFQYIGEGYGVQDVAYLLISSVQSRLLDNKGETQLLQYYHHWLIKALDFFESQRPKSVDVPPPSWHEYTFKVVEEQYAVAVLDFTRFLAGWGMWGNSKYAIARSEECIAEMAFET
ncbi:hypothetical protein BJ742DRAFT_819208 [Cladochytrium replicatum]|nr:hypothetical protein BJ742DRAFT_819208 [Cladochytrium replicatum]